ncbi:GNAT family N-acetyltransferase [Devosia rhodophyticola]|uniref:GNAT family N-acetyltransferase n=1 Tax=Devosia rhodophyticola TaxID=3026423 RepID=A0ABY7YU11_9HYPH|nr:GNAT family N-acetyltransferase [Devosia rhodophyticola]WDR04863.1 GNAT family N-acetyltransferase [Devosia rhodophyticola]
MSDLLVRLYDLPEFEAEEKVRVAGVVIRRALPPEGHVVLAWIREHFSEIWASEATHGLAQMPVTCLVAVRGGQILGFACYDTTAKGFFGPTGVAEDQRGQGIGEVLLISTLRAMREAGYGYAIIGDPGPVAFYQKRLDAMIIPHSTPGVYAGMLASVND